jgi:DNA-binding XRE family transcriptional regulator
MTAKQFTRRRQKLYRTQTQAAEALGVGRTTIVMWETGKNPVPRWAILFLECLSAAVQYAPKTATGSVQ